MNDTQDIILAELRAHALSTGERLSALETSMRTLVGNGQPGRITQIEESVKGLERWKWKVLGISTGGSAVVSAVLWLIHLIH
jgi:hypothetical protein